MRLPAASFVSMVDAVLCAVSVLIIMIVVLPRASSQPGYLPRAEMMIRCEARTPVDMSVTASSAGAPGARLELTAGEAPQQAVLAIRRMLDAELRRLETVSARLAVSASGKFALRCMDLLACAVERRERACRIPEVEPWAPPEGAAIPIVTTLYGEPDEQP